VQEKLSIALGPKNRAIGDRNRKAELPQSFSHFVARELMSGRVAHNPASAYQLAAYLELRFDQNDPVSLRTKKWHQRRDQ
jgi:hypothetical protein